MSLFLLAVDLNWLMQFIFTVLILAVGLLHLVKNTASRYFLAEDNDHSSDWSTDVTVPPSAAAATTSISNSSHSGMMSTVTTTVVDESNCAVCGSRTKKKCSACKIVMYCSESCQKSHWRSEHKKECKDFQVAGKSILSTRRGGSLNKLISSGGSSKSLNQLKKILFPYEDFVEFFNWEKPGFPPCGLLNCGNSCFANAVLQCLAYTRPLIAFLLERGHKRGCRRNDWCFLCEFQSHVERANQSLHPFSPINILSRLPNIGGNLGYGKQEDAHEFMRFAIDTMQSVCLDEFGGEKVVHPSSQETTLIQHIFGGHLQSQVICTKCNNISNQFENMMDLTVEIQGDASSLEDCLDQFTAKEWLHGDNMYKCDGCNDYVLAWKRLTVRRAPNILTIALKRFQSGRFGKLNKRVTFPVTLDLSPYMSETAEDGNIYKLYAVIVHVDMLNASFFGHYICYIKDFCGKWYRVDDCKVTRVDLDEVLSQGAYMLLYSRISVRPSSLYPVEAPSKEEQENVEVEKDMDLSSTHCAPADTIVDSLNKNPSHASMQLKVGVSEIMLSSTSKCEETKEKEGEVMDFKENCPVSVDDELCEIPLSVTMQEVAVPLGHTPDLGSITIPATTPNLTEADNLKMEQPYSNSNFLEDSGSSNRIPQDSIAFHVDLKEEMPLALPCSCEIPEETNTKPADSREKSNPYGTSFSGGPPSNLCRETSRASDEKCVGALFDQDAVAFPNHIDMKEASLDVSAAIVSSGNIHEEIESTSFGVKTVARGLRLSNGIPASDISKDSRKPEQKCSVGNGKPLFSPNFHKKDSVVSQNDVGVQEGMPLDFSVAPFSSTEVVEETVAAAYSLDETRREATSGIASSHGYQDSDGFQDALRKSDDGCFVAMAKPLSPLGLQVKNLMAPKNHVYNNVGETKTVDSKDVIAEAACGMQSLSGVPLSSRLEGAARKSEGPAKPLFPLGFLNKKKYVKMESEVSAEAGEVISADISQNNNGVENPSVASEVDDAMTDRDKGRIL